MAETSDDRRRLLVSHIVAARRDDDPVTFRAGDVEVTYDDRILKVELTSDERERLEALLESYHVFKIKQPETRKADERVVYLSAVTDAKHASDFIDALFSEVYGFKTHYELRVNDIE